MNKAERIALFRRRPGERPLVLGHRGARAHAPENTLRAFDEALAQGADGVELDVRSSADGLLVIAHDEEILVRGHVGPVEIGRLSGSQLQRLRLLSGEKLPTLEQTLAWRRDTGTLLNVEVKGDVAAPLDVARRTAALVRRFGGDGILFSSFDVRQVLALRRHLPEVPTALLIHDEQRLFRRFAPYRWFGAVGIHPQLTLATAPRVAVWKGHDAVVNVWTVNDGDDAIALAERGVDGIITDSPRAILAALAKSPRFP